MATTTATARRISLLQTLIDHARTGDEERAAARRALARLQAKDDDTPVRYDRCWYGAKYDQVSRLSTTEIAALIRADLKLARKAGKMAAKAGDLAVADPIADAPDGIRFSVRSEYFSGGSAIRIAILRIPEAWGYEEREDRDWPGRKYTGATEALADLGMAVKAVMNAYNYDGSDSQTDYYDVNFYGSVSDDRGMSLGYRYH